MRDNLLSKCNQQLDESQQTEALDEIRHSSLASGGSGERDGVYVRQVIGNDLLIAGSVAASARPFGSLWQAGELTSGHSDRSRRADASKSVAVGQEVMLLPDLLPLSISSIDSLAGFAFRQPRVSLVDAMMLSG